MKWLFKSLNEKDRRRYAAVEAAKLGRGGLGYIAELFGMAPKTIRQGRRDLKLTDDAAARSGSQKRGDVWGSSKSLPGSNSTFSRSSVSTLLVARSRAFAGRLSNTGACGCDE
jgi:hypothetical protein